jgi:hypothetical protein
MSSLSLMHTPGGSSDDVVRQQGCEGEQRHMVLAGKAYKAKGIVCRGGSNETAGQAGVRATATNN